MQEHTLTAFDADIDGMRTAVVTMGALVERQFTRAIDAIRYGDLKLISKVLEDEQVVNRLHIQADLLCNQILAKRQPLAVDLREVIAAIHSINDLERVGDESKKIALKARDMDMNQQRLDLPLERVHQMAEKVREMLSHALDAFIRHDAHASDKLSKRDTEIDALRDELRTTLMQRMSASPDAVSTALDMVFVVQSIERIGDHAKNIAEYVAHVVEGIDRRHQLSPAG